MQRHAKTLLYVCFGKSMDSERIDEVKEQETGTMSNC